MKSKRKKLLWASLTIGILATFGTDGGQDLILLLVDLLKST